MKYKKVLVMGGTHGNERTGVDLVLDLQKQPIDFIKPMIANPKAVKNNIRYVETDLNRSAGKKLAVSYEEGLATSLVTKIKPVDLVIEFHNTTAKNNTCAIVTTKPSKLHFQLMNHFGLTKVLVMPASGSLSGISPSKFFSLEISNSDKKFTNIKYLKEKLIKLNSINSNIIVQPKIYKFVGTSVNKITLARLGVHLSKLNNFQMFSKRDAVILNLPTNRKFCPVFIGEKAYGKDFGFHIVELINKVVFWYNEYT